MCPSYCLIQILSETISLAYKVEGGDIEAKDSEKKKKTWSDSNKYSAPYQFVQ